MTDEYYAIAYPPATTGASDALITTLRLRGELDLGACDDLRSAVLGVIAAGSTPQIVIDVTEVSFIDAATVSVLINGYHAAQRHGLKYRLTGAHGTVQHVLDVLGVADLLQPDNFGRPGHPCP